MVSKEQEAHINIAKAARRKLSPLLMFIIGLLSANLELI